MATLFRFPVAPEGDGAPKPPPAPPPLLPMLRLTEAIVEIPDSDNITNEAISSNSDANILSNDNLNDLFSGYVAK